MRDRYALIGLSRPRAEWFRSVALWATAGAIPAEFTKCVSVEELRARLGSGRVWSAALVDAGVAGADRDLVAAIVESGTVPVVVDDRGQHDWRALGVQAVLTSDFDRDELLRILELHASRVGAGSDVLPDAPETPVGTAEELGPVAVVCGTGGCGASSVAIALAQGLAEADADRPVLLADLCLRADQAALHDARDIVPSVQELVEAHRGRRPGQVETQSLTFYVEERGYHLLLGLRRAKYWASLRPRAFTAAMTSLRAAFGPVVCDIEADLEGEADGGSADVEERNVMARTAVAQARVVFAVASCDFAGVLKLVRLIGELVDHGVRGAAIVPVLNRAPRNPRWRAQLTATVAELAGPLLDGEQLFPPVFLPEKGVEEALRDGVALPAPLAPVLAGAWRAGLERTAERTPQAPPQRIEPGSLGSLAGMESR